MFGCTQQLPPCKFFNDALFCNGFVEPGSHGSLSAGLSVLMQLHCDRLEKHIDGCVAAHHEELLRRISEEQDGSRSCTLDGPDPDHHEETNSHPVLHSFDTEEMMKRSKSIVVQPPDSCVSLESETMTLSLHGLSQSISQRLVESTKFEVLVCTIIIVNVLFLSIEVQVTMGTHDSPLVFNVVELAFAVIFAVEFVIRILAHGIRDFVSGKNRVANLFDFACVAAALLQALVDFFEDIMIPNFVVARLLRVLRMARVFRIIRIVQFFRPMRILVSSLATTFKSLGWALTLLLMIIYLFGMLFTMAVSDAIGRPGAELAELADAREHFGSLWRSSASLFKAMSGGNDWDVYFLSLSGVGATWSLLFILFIAFSQIAVLNIITGIVCHGAIESAQQDQDVVVDAHLAMKQKYVDELMAIFNSIDFDNSGSIGLQEFEDRLQDPALRAYFLAMDLTTDEAWSLFKLLDTSEDGLIKPDDFVAGCLKLKGTARSQDVHMLMYESRWTRRRLEDLTAKLQELASARRPSGLQLQKTRDCFGA